MSDDFDRSAANGWDLFRLLHVIGLSISGGPMAYRFIGVFPPLPHL